MSSVGKMAAAQVLPGFADPEASAPSSTRQVVESPDPGVLSLEALGGGAEPPFRGEDLSALWVRFARGELRAWREIETIERHYLIAGASRGPTASLREEVAAIIVSLLSGEAGKAVAANLGIAPSTVARHRVQTFSSFAMKERAPLPLVLAAQSWAGITTVPTARVVAFEQGDRTYVSASIPRPMTSHLDALTLAEREIAVSLMKGDTRHEIAARRGSSPNTVAAQIHAIYGALRVTGRFALIRRAAEEGCFS